MRKIAAVVILTCTATGAWAQAQTTTQKVEAQSVTTTQASPTSTNVLQSNALSGMSTNTRKTITGSASLGVSSNLYDRSSYDSETTTSAEGVLNYRVSGLNVARVYLAASQSSRSQETNMKDGYVAWVNDRFWKEGEIMNVGQHLRLIAPLSRESVKRDERLTGVTVAPIATFNLTPAGLTGVMLAYQPAATKNFHKYETNRAFASNNEYTLSQLFRAIWSFTDQAYVLSDFIYRNFWSYQGTRKNDVSTYSLEVGYTFLNNVSVSLGVSTDSTIRNFENATDTNVELFNTRRSSVVTGLSYVF